MRLEPARDRRAGRRRVEKVFGEELELVYEIRHNLVQAEEHPGFGEVWVHRKGHF